MRPRELHRLVSAALGAAGAGALSVALGAPLPGAVPALLAGGFAAWLLTAERPMSAGLTADLGDSFDTARSILHDLLRAFNEPLLLVERQQVTMANQAALDLLGTHIVGENVRLAIRHPAAAEKLTGNANRSPVELMGIGEADRHWELNVHDIDDHRKLISLFDRTNRHIAERMRVDFVANASHELRTPLATLIGFIETLEDGKAAEDKETRERFLGIMSGEAKRMQRLIDDLISLSRIEADKFSPPDSAVAIVPLIREVSHAACAGFDAGDERIILTPADPALQVRGDRAQLSQLLHNVIGNALKYGRPGTAVTVSAGIASNGMVKIVVIDQGEGIATEHLPRLTERFYRVDPGRSRALGGTGLGLAIVKHIVERHRGQLEIRSELGVGTEVSVLLPAAPGPLS